MNVIIKKIKENNFKKNSAFHDKYIYICMKIVISVISFIIKLYLLILQSLMVISFNLL